jgi:hypothetical protein
MSLVTPWPSVRQAVVRALRANLVLADQMPEDRDWNEGSSPQGTPFPHGVYSLAYGPPEYDWTGVVHLIGVDVVVYSTDQGEAASLDQLVFITLQDARLAVTGLTTLSCRRIGIISLTDADATGRKVYVLGGTYQLRVSQSNPIKRELSFDLGMTIG